MLPAMNCWEEHIVKIFFCMQIIILVLIAYSIFLYIWTHNISNNLIRISNSLKDILDTKNADKNRILPLVSNDEFSDLSYYYNKIQELTAKNIEQIHENQSCFAGASAE